MPYSTSYPALAYYYQLDYNPMVIANRFIFPNYYGVGYQRLMYRGDTIRSFVLNPTTTTPAEICDCLPLILFKAPRPQMVFRLIFLCRWARASRLGQVAPLHPIRPVRRLGLVCLLRQIHSLGTDARRWSDLDAAHLFLGSGTANQRIRFPDAVYQHRDVKSKKPKLILWRLQ